MSFYHKLYKETTQPYVMMTEVSRIKKERFGMVVNPKDIKKIDKLAISREVSRSHLIREAIKKFLEENNATTN